MVPMCILRGCGTNISLDILRYLSRLTHPEDSVGDGGRFGSTEVVLVASEVVAVGTRLEVPARLGGLACAETKAANNGTATEAREEMRIFRCSEQR